MAETTSGGGCGFFLAAFLRLAITCLSDRLRSAEGVSKYITKYITKDLNETRIDLNDHLYYCSHGLQRAKKLYQGPLTKEIEEDYSNEYVKIKTVRTLEEALTYFTDAEESVKLTVRAPQ